MTRRSARARRLRAQSLPIVLAPNMSLGVNLLFRLAELAARALRRSSTTPRFSRHITATRSTRRAARRWRSARPSRWAAAWTLDAVGRYTRGTARPGPRGRAHIGFSVHAGWRHRGRSPRSCSPAPGSSIELAHSAQDRSGFARGALRGGALGRRPRRQACTRMHGRARPVKAPTGKVPVALVARPWRAESASRRTRSTPTRETTRHRSEPTLIPGGRLHARIRASATARRVSQEGTTVTTPAVLATRGRHGVSRRFHRCRRHDDRRGRLQYRHDGLPGDPHRPVLLPPDRHADLPAHRQHRHQSGRPRVERRSTPPGLVIRDLPLLQLELARHRNRCPSSWTARQRRCHRRHRHPQADPDPAREGRAVGLHRDRRRRHRDPTWRIAAAQALSRPRRAWTSRRSVSTGRATSGTRARTGPSSRGRSAAPGQRLHVVAYDFGIKRNILRLLADHGCRMTVVPAQTPADEVLALEPDGIFLSNGPGDPEPCTYAIEAIRELPRRGHAAVRHLPRAPAARPRGAARSTVKMKFGHHGANHPVLDIETGRVVHLPARTTASRWTRRRCRRTCARRTGRCSTARCRASRCTRPPGVQLPGPPGGEPGSARLAPLFSRFVESMLRRVRPRHAQTVCAAASPSPLQHRSLRLNAEAHRPREHPDHRRRPDRDRAGLRVRLLRRAGLQGAARGGLPRHPGQLESRPRS